MPKPHLAISIRQPWAWAILHAGKDIENRTWCRKHRGPVLIHASKGWRSVYARECLAHVRTLAVPGTVYPVHPLTAFSKLTGGIIGVVDVVDIVRGHASPWAMADCWHWVLANPRPLPFYPCKGALGLFGVNYPDELWTTAPAETPLEAAL